MRDPNQKPCRACGMPVYEECANAAIGGLCMAGTMFKHKCTLSEARKIAFAGDGAAPRVGLPDAGGRPEKPPAEVRDVPGQMGLFGGTL